MRINKTKSKNYEHYSIIYDISVNGKRTTKTYENIGNYEKLKKRSGDVEPLSWLNNYVQKLNKEVKEQTLPVIIKKHPNKRIDKDTQLVFNAGYLFLQDIYYKLGLNNICSKITSKYQFKFDLNNILSNLIYSRIIYPASKLKTFELTKKFIEQPNFELHDIYRALEIISKENDFIQSELYTNSLKYSKRNDKILFYDCTNYYFEIEQDDDFRKYGKSKENRPNPIVGMGLFLDGDGIPLAFSTFPGNQNEQPTLQPLEEKIINDFRNSKFIVCTDAGLASISNRKFNNTNNRRFVTTQSLKKLKGFLKEDALDLTKGWKLLGNNKNYDISKFRGYKMTDNEEENKKRQYEYELLLKAYRDIVFYKERWIKEDGIEQRLIVTYSVKYQEYQKNLRENQVNRALKMIEKNPKKIGKVRENDPKRFIETITTTEDGEVAEKINYTINEKAILEEAKYDGLYAVCTNLEDDAEEIININKQRWEIEESFRIMKSEFKARPVYLSNEDRIKAHFTTCFLALVIYRYLEKKLDEKYTVTEITETLRDYNLKNINDVGYEPNYKRTEITDFLHNKFGFYTDYEFVNNKFIKKIIQ
ncbi:MAG: IS1634 family transposase, partial [Malacoplasma sp.]